MNGQRCFHNLSHAERPLMRSLWGKRVAVALINGSLITNIAVTCSSIDVLPWTLWNALLPWRKSRPLKLFLQSLQLLKLKRSNDSCRRSIERRQRTFKCSEEEAVRSRVVLWEPINRPQEKADRPSFLYGHETWSRVAAHKSARRRIYRRSLSSWRRGAATWCKSAGGAGDIPIWTKQQGRFWYLPFAWEVVFRHVATREDAEVRFYRGFWVV